MTFASFLESVENDPAPPENLAPELQSLWFAQADRWEEAHGIIEDIPTATGSWVHGLLHAIEGDFGNAGYWFSKAGKPPVTKAGIEAEWERIVRHQLLG